MNIQAERQPIFVHYDHLVKWIASCYLTEQIMKCSDAIDNFENVFKTHAAKDIFIRDLKHQWSLRHQTLANIELVNIQNAA